MEHQAMYGHLQEEIFKFATSSYNGTLDGAGHSITGLFFYDTKGAGYYGLFAKMGRGTVKNLAIVDSFFWRS